MSPIRDQAGPETSPETSRLSKPEESLIGELVVLAGLSMGRERLRLYFTGERILAAHMGKRGGTGAATTFFGILGSAIEPLFRKSRTGPKGSQPSPQEVLRWDKDNFQVPYAEIVSFSQEVGEFRTLITVVTKSDKLRFEVVGRLQEKLSLELKNRLGDRMITKRLSAET